MRPSSWRAKADATTRYLVPARSRDRIRHSACRACRATRSVCHTAGIGCAQEVSASCTHRCARATRSADSV
jgi:hypothetical protein